MSFEFQLVITVFFLPLFCNSTLFILPLLVVCGGAETPFQSRSEASSSKPDENSTDQEFREGAIKKGEIITSPR
jgi:hypothetical protein